MHATEKEISFGLRDIVDLWYKGWDRSRGRDAPPTIWENSSGSFLDQYLSREIRQARVDQFLDPKQRKMSVREYSFYFDSLARYAPSIVATMRDKIHMLIAGLAPEFTEACATAALQDSKDISWIQAFTKNIEKGRHRQQGTERSEQGLCKRMRFAGYKEQSRGSYRPQYFGRPPRPPPPQLQGYSFDRYAQSGPDDEIPTLQSIPTVREYTDVFLDELPEEEHVDHLRAALQTLWDLKFYDKFSKCEFWLKSIAFLGHIVSDEDVKVDTQKIEAVKCWPRPTNSTEQKELNLQQRRWLELLKDCDVKIPYHPGKANVVADTLSRRSMGSLAHVEAEKRELPRELYQLACLGVWLVDSDDGGVVLQNTAKSSLIAEVKERH
ncbi:uncharacterized protein [Nicotiana tomentosiformis]|uniref:uncharacterized protein n=1 Tax=Nicotiana tomentosiformis TaxID=4098 RepID=UPI00388C6A9D